MVGYGKLKRTTENTPDLPSGLTPETLITTPVAGTTFVDATQSKWHRFGAGVDVSITINRNINYHNDIGQREYTVATTGIVEPDFTINGYISATNLGWLQYVLNMTDAEVASATVAATGSQTVTYSYTDQDGPQTFDCAYVKVNSKTNDYAGDSLTNPADCDEFHILTGCAVDTATFSYEMGSDAGVKFTLECKALMDYFSLGNIAAGVDINTYFDTIPADVFSTGCVSKSTDNSTYNIVAQTDSASLTISNFLERRGNCNKNWGSGYSMGTLNFEVSTSTYSNDPGKYMMALYGYASTGTPAATMGVTKIPYVIPYLKVYTDNSDPVAGTTATKSLSFNLTNTIAGQMQYTYNAENAILDEPTLRSRKLAIAVKSPTS